MLRFSCAGRVEVPAHRAGSAQVTRSLRWCKVHVDEHAARAQNVVCRVGCGAGSVGAPCSRVVGPATPAACDLPAVSIFKLESLRKEPAQVVR